MSALLVLPTGNKLNNELENYKVRFSNPKSIRIKRNVASQIQIQSSQLPHINNVSVAMLHLSLLSWEPDLSNYNKMQEHFVMTYYNVSFYD